MDEFFLFMLTVIGVPMGFYFLGAYLKIKLQSLRQKHNLIEPNANTKNMQQQIEYLMHENEEIKEELHNIKYLLSRQDKRERIDLDYEKEQMRLDYDAKGSLSL